MASNEPTYWNPQGDALSQAQADSRNIDDFANAMNNSLRNLSGQSNTPFLFTNIPEAAAEQRQAGGLYQYSAPIEPVESTGGSGIFGSNNISEPFKAISSIISSIDKEEDTVKKQQMLVGLEASAGEYISKEAVKARERATEELGISALQRQLQQNELLDKQDPLYAQYRADSKGTAQIRERLARAESQVDNHSRRLLQENGELIRYTKTIDGYLKLQQNLIQKKELADVNKAKTIEQKQEASRGLMETILPEVRESFAKDIPALKDPLLLAQFLAAPRQAQAKRDLDQIMSGEIRPDNYLSAGLAGNGVALRLAAAEQTSRTGKSRDEVDGQLRSLHSFIANPASILEPKNAALFGLNKAEVDAYKTKLLTGGKEAKQELANLAISRADTFVSQLEGRKLAGDVLSWQAAPGEPRLDQLPGAAEVITRLQQETGKKSVDIDSFISKYITPELPKEEVAKRTELLLNRLDGTVTQLRIGLYGNPIDSVSLRNQIKTKAILAAIKRSPFGSSISAF